MVIHYYPHIETKIFIEEDMWNNGGRMSSHARIEGGEF